MAESESKDWLTALITGGFATFVTIWKIVENRSKKKESGGTEKQTALDNIELENYYQKQLEAARRELTEEKQKSANYIKEIEESKKKESDLLRDLNQKERENTVLRIQVKAKNN